MNTCYSPVPGLEQQIANQRAKIKELQDVAAQLGVDRNRAECRSTELGHQLEDEQRRVVSRDNVILDLQRGLDVRGRKITELRDAAYLAVQQVNELKVEVDGLKVVIKEQSTRITDLDNERQQLLKKVSGYKDLSEFRAREVVEVNLRNNDLVEQLTAQRLQLKAQDARIKELGQLNDTRLTAIGFILESNEVHIDHRDRSVCAR